MRHLYDATKHHGEFHRSEVCTLRIDDNPTPPLPCSPDVALPERILALPLLAHEVQREDLEHTPDRHHINSVKTVIYFPMVAQCRVYVQYSCLVH